EAGYLYSGDPSDYFLLGNFAAGVTIQLGTRYPSASALAAKVEVVYASGTILTDADGDPNNDTATATTNATGAYYAHVLPKSGAGLLGQYLLDMALTNTTPPLVVSNTLPAEGTTSTAILDRFTLGFSEDLTAATVNN